MVPPHPVLCSLGVFLGLGLSGIIPALHYIIAEGFLKAATIGQIGWLLLMASLYITGAALYAARIPERFFPGKCDIWVSAQASQSGVVGGRWWGRAETPHGRPRSCAPASAPLSAQGRNCACGAPCGAGPACTSSRGPGRRSSGSWGSLCRSERGSGR